MKTTSGYFSRLLYRRVVMLVFYLVGFIICLCGLAIVLLVAGEAAGRKNNDQTQFALRLRTIARHLNGEGKPPQAIEALLVSPAYERKKTGAERPLTADGTGGSAHDRDLGVALVSGSSAQPKQSKANASNKAKPPSDTAVQRKASCQTGAKPAKESRRKSGARTGQAA